MRASEQASAPSFSLRLRQEGAPLRPVEPVSGGRNTASRMRAASATRIPEAPITTIEGMSPLAIAAPHWTLKSDPRIASIGARREVVGRFTSEASASSVRASRWASVRRTAARRWQPSLAGRDGDAPDDSPQVEVGAQLLAVLEHERPVFRVVARVEQGEHETPQVEGFRLPEMSAGSKSTLFGSGLRRAVNRGRLQASQ